MLLRRHFNPPLILITAEGGSLISRTSPLQFSFAVLVLAEEYNQFHNTSSLTDFKYFPKAYFSADLFLDLSDCSVT